MQVFQFSMYCAFNEKVDRISQHFQSFPTTYATSVKTLMYYLSVLNNDEEYMN